MNIPLPGPLEEYISEKGYCTVGEFAKGCGIHPVTALRMCQAGEIPATDVSRSQKRAEWRIFGSSLRQWISQRTRQQTQPSSPLPELFDEDGNWTG